MMSKQQNNRSYWRIFVSVVLSIMLAIVVIIGCSQEKESPVAPRSNAILNFYTTRSESNQFEYRKGNEIFCLNIPIAGDYLLSYTTNNGTFYIVFRAQKSARLYVGLEDADALQALSLYKGVVSVSASPLQHDGDVILYASPSSPEVAWGSVFTFVSDNAQIELQKGGGECPPKPSPTPVPVTSSGGNSCGQQNSLIYASQNLAGHDVAAECNPGGGTSCPCSSSDVSIASLGSYGTVTSNAQAQNTYVNAIGHRKFIETLSNGCPVVLSRYKYSAQIRLPVLPAPDVNQQQNSDAVHIMAQVYDGRDALFPSNKTTLEASIYWEINPWSADYGKIKVYTKPTTLIDTGIIITPNTGWNSFQVIADFASKKYVSITINGQTKDLSSVDLAQVHQPSWGNEVALIITTESMATWPQTNCSNVFTWTTQFRNVELRYF